MDPAAVERLLQDKKFSLTPQRRAILRFLMGNPTHPSAAQIYEAVTHELPVSSRATVYNTLELLEQLGVVRALRLPGEDQSRYDPNPAPHHHFLCEACGGLWDLEAPEVELRPTLPPGFVAQQASVLLRGRCPACSGT